MLDTEESPGFAGTAYGLFGNEIASDTQWASLPFAFCPFHAQVITKNLPKNSFQT